MALWQVDFTLVPRRAVATSERLALSQLLGTAWWRAEHLPLSHERQLGAIASPGTSSASDVQTWGDPDGNRIDVWLENGKPARMTARVDVRRLDATFGAKLLRFTRVADALLVRGDGLVIEPTVGAFGAALRTSDAWKYASDPAALPGQDVDEDDDE